MQRCPCCNARLKDATNCPRCKADLRESIRVQQSATYWYRKALDCYLHNELQSCLDALSRSLQLHHSQSALMFKAFVMERRRQTMEMVILQRIGQDFILLSSLLIKRLINDLTNRFDKFLHAEKMQNRHAESANPTQERSPTVITFGGEKVAK